MNITEPLEQMDIPYVLAVGKFDGMHRGHQAIFEELGRIEPDCRRAAYVFYLPNEEQLSPLNERLELLGEAGVEQTAVITAGSGIWQMQPEEFIAALCRTGMLRGIVVGQGFRFGRGAAGDTKLLSELGGRYGFQVRVVQPVKVGGSVVSSSVIRRALSRGDMPCVTQCLGRPYTLRGRVVTGRQLGRTMDFPTANLLPPRDKLLPARGVYAAIARVEGHAYAAMTNIGENPTVDGDHITVESHVIGLDADLYGKELELSFVRRVRREQKFSSLEKLKKQLEQDKQHIITLFSTQFPDEKWV